ncbi:RteC protein [Ancylomarina subtilis]|uniref:RteC protein n=1 Tax=Ancylomarina subtilis TaxID=1639035 RepID=A0A4Q7VEN1_9BACT|nr:RteC domain-containing protein [Ancylomarina subtilis]RZT93568.1 RteC protein [Ancylomarina subtilis]
MIKNSSLVALENELSKANVVFKDEGGLSTLYFNNFSNPNDFKEKLDSLYLNFSKELSQNLRGLTARDSRLHHLELVLRIFVSLQEKLGSNLTLLNSPVEVSTKNEIAATCICSKISDVQDLISYICFQKNTILESIRLIKTYRLKFRKNANEYWKDVFKDFYPYYCRLKEQLSEIGLIQDRIQFLKDQRKELEIVFQEKGVNLFDSPLNLFFEFHIDGLKDLYFSSKLNPTSKPIEQHLKWSGDKVKFIELILSLDLLKVVEFMDGSPISRKELFRRFEIFFDLPHINDLGSRIHKLKMRSNTTPFLDELKENCNRFLNDND